MFVLVVKDAENFPVSENIVVRVSFTRIPPPHAKYRPLADSGWLQCCQIQISKIRIIFFYCQRIWICTDFFFTGTDFYFF